MTFSRTTGRTSHMAANPCTLYPASSQAKQISRECVCWCGKGTLFSAEARTALKVLFPEARCRGRTSFVKASCLIFETSRHWLSLSRLRWNEEKRTAWLFSGASPSGLRQVGPIRSHHTGFYVVGEIDSKDFVSQIPNILAVFDGKQDLNSSIEIARHEISTPSINLFLIIVPEVVYAAVLQESAHHTYDANVLADTGYIRAQTADAPHQEVHFHSRLGSTIEKPDHLAVNQRVHFEDKVAPAMPTVTCNFAFN